MRSPPNQKLRELSSESGGARLCRAEISEEQSRWWRENWRHPGPVLDMPGQTRTVAEQRLSEKTTIKFVRQYDRVQEVDVGGGFGWARLSPNRIVPCVRIELGDLYDVHATYRAARAKKNPKLAPHGFLRTLSYRDHSQAVKFMARFGPLVTDDRTHFLYSSLKPELFSGWVNLDDFWARQVRFERVSRLYEALNSEQPEAQLRQAWSALRSGQTEINSPSGLPPLLLRPWLPDSTGAAYSGEIDERWIETAPLSELREQAMHLIFSVLNAHAGKGSGWPSWVHVGGYGFRPALEVGSLWAAIWQFFGLDTSTGRPWRICPHCGKLFYPPRKDRFYCTPKLQQLYSKRKWWHRNRSGRRKQSKRG